VILPNEVTRRTSPRNSTGCAASVGERAFVDRIVEHAVLGGFELTGVFEDAVSGVKNEGERPGFRAALDAIRRGEASVLMVTDADRLARDSDVAGHARVEIRRAGGKVVVISEVDAGVEVVAVRQLLATLEREKIRARMRTWSAARVRKGLHMGPPPFGTRVAPDGTLQPEPAEAPTVARILDLRRSGASLRAVADALNAEGVRGPGGRPWNLMTVLNVAKRAGR
jgi:site-specific DNA recombinase